MVNIAREPEKTVVIPETYILSLTDDECFKFMGDLHRLSQVGFDSEVTQEIFDFLSNRKMRNYNA